MPSDTKVQDLLLNAVSKADLEAIQREAERQSRSRAAQLRLVLYREAERIRRAELELSKPEVAEA